MSLRYLHGETTAANEVAVFNCERLARIALGQKDMVAFHQHLRAGYRVLGNLFMVYNEMREELLALRGEQPLKEFTEEQQERWDFCSHRQSVQLLLMQGYRPNAPRCCDECGKAQVKTSLDTTTPGMKKLLTRCGGCGLLETKFVGGGSSTTTLRTYEDVKHGRQQ